MDNIIAEFHADFNSVTSETLAVSNELLHLIDRYKEFLRSSRSLNEYFEYSENLYFLSEKIKELNQRVYEKLINEKQ